MRTPCGSSSGSGVVVATGLVDVAIGTETNGSVSCPSSVNGIVGIKPTVGLVSRSELFQYLQRKTLLDLWLIQSLQQLKY